MATVESLSFIGSEQKCLPEDRLLVKPVVSCYWRIGGKNDLNLREQIELDRKYVE